MRTSLPKEDLVLTCAAPVSTSTPRTVGAERQRRTVRRIASGGASAPIAGRSPRSRAAGILSPDVGVRSESLWHGAAHIFTLSAPSRRITCRLLDEVQPNPCRNLPAPDGERPYSFRSRPRHAVRRFRYRSRRRTRRPRSSSRPLPRRRLRSRSRSRYSSRPRPSMTRMGTARAPSFGRPLSMVRSGRVRRSSRTFRPVSTLSRRRSPTSTGLKRVPR